MSVSGNPRSASPSSGAPPVARMTTTDSYATVRRWPLGREVPSPFDRRADRITARSVAWQRRIHLLLPAQDPAAQVRHPAEARVHEMACGRPAASPALTVNDDLALAIERLDDVRERRQRHELCARNVRNVPFELLAHIDQLQILPARQPAPQLARR